MEKKNPKKNFLILDWLEKGKTQTYLNYVSSLSDINVGKRGKLGRIDIKNLYNDFQPKPPKKK